MNEVAALDALTAGQYRAARAMLGWSLIETGRRADVSPASVLSLERELNTAPERSRRALAEAYTAASVAFHGSPADGFGLTFRPLTLGPSSSIR